MTNQLQHTFIEPSIDFSFSMQPSYSMKDGVTDYPSPKGWGTVLVPTMWHKVLL